MGSVVDGVVVNVTNGVVDGVAEDVVDSVADGVANSVEVSFAELSWKSFYHSTIHNIIMLSSVWDVISIRSDQFSVKPSVFLFYLLIQTKLFSNA